MNNYSFENIFYFTLAPCILSIVSNLLIFIAYVFFKDLRNYNYRIVFYMSISEIITSIGKFQIAFLIPGLQDHGLCEVQAILLNFSCLSSVMWTNVIAFTIYRSLVLGKTDGWKYEMYYLLYAFGIPLSLNFLPMLTESFGHAEGWCWIRIEGKNFIYGFLAGNIWRVINYLAPLWIIIFFNFFLHFRSIEKIKKMTDNIDDDFNKNLIVRRLFLYPIMLLVCHLPISFHRTLGFFDIVSGQLVWISAVVSGIFLIFSGFLNALVYGLTDRVKRELQKILETPDQSSSSHSPLSEEAYVRDSLI